MSALALSADLASIENRMSRHLDVAERLRSQFNFIAPRGGSQSAMSSDCCSSNNYPEEPREEN